MAKDSGKVNIHGKEYSTVAKRVQSFREEYKQQYSLETEIVSINNEIVVMKATIKRIALDDDHQTPIANPVVVATGHAEEKRSSSMINKTSALENCETSAEGRALAAFGLAGTEFASADEVANAIHQQNIPAKEFNPVWDEQEKQIRALAVMLGYSEKVINAKLATIRSSDDAKNMIKKLEDLHKKQEEEQSKESF